MPNPILTQVTARIMSQSTPARAPTRRASGRQLDNTARGVACVVVAVFLFAVMNTLFKSLSSSFAPTQLVFFRAFFGFLPLFVLVGLDSRGWRNIVSAAPKTQVVRAGSAFIANALIVLSYRFMPLADAVAIGYAAPIFVTVLAAPILAEHVGRDRWAAVLIGFGGVLLVARPSSGLIDPGALFAIAGTFCYAICIIATRRLGAADAPLTTMLWSTALYVVFGATTLPWVWTTPTLAQLPALVMIGCLATAGMFFFVRAYRYAEAASLAPFDYMAMGWAVVFGFVVFGEVPQPGAVVGIAVIVATGLYIVHRESRRRRADTSAST